MPAVNSGIDQPTRYRAILGNNELVAILAARFLSGIGDQAARAVLALYVLDKSGGDALLSALVLAVSYVPSTFGFAFLGSLADRYPRRTVMLVADVARSILIGLLGTRRDLRLRLLGRHRHSARGRDVLCASAVGSIVADATGRTYTRRVPGGRRAWEHFRPGRAGLGFRGWWRCCRSDICRLCTASSTPSLSSSPSCWSSDSSFIASPRLRTGQTFVVCCATCEVVCGPRSRHHRLRAVVLLLWATAALLVATDAVALPYADSIGAEPWQATMLLAATPAGAAIGSLLVARLPIGQQIRLVFPLAFASTVPMLATAAGTRPGRRRRRLWLVAGLCQGYVVTLMAMTMQLTPEQRRGRVFGVAGAGFNGMAIVGLVGLGAIAAAHLTGGGAGFGGCLGTAGSDSGSLALAAARCARCGSCQLRRDEPEYLVVGGGDMKALVKRTAGTRPGTSRRPGA